MKIEIIGTLLIQSYFLGALAHGGEVLVVRRVGRPRDGIDVNLHRDVHNCTILLVANRRTWKMSACFFILLKKV